MKEKHAEHGIEWRLVDVRDMQGMEDASVDVAFDKGTLDAMIYGSPWSPPQEVKDNTSAYLREVCVKFCLCRSPFVFCSAGTIVFSSLSPAAVMLVG